jgi:hypothetical protein
MNNLITLLIEYFLPNKLFKKRIFCLCFITYMGHLNLGNILFMFHHRHGTFKFREFSATASNQGLQVGNALDQVRSRWESRFHVRKEGFCHSGHGDGRASKMGKMLLPSMAVIKS